MKIVVSAVLLLLQPMITKSVPGINAGEVWLLSNCFHLSCPDQLTLPPVKVVNASISQLYSDEVLSSLVTLDCFGG